MFCPSKFIALQNLKKFSYTIPFPVPEVPSTDVK